MRFDELYLRSVVKSIEERIRLTKLDLSGLNVLTEAATGAYCVTPVIAAMAGAKEVVAYTRDSRYGSVQDVISETQKLINAVGKSLPVNIVDEISLNDYAKADIVTNSGHLRPIMREHIMSMKTTAVIPLMYERWELRKSDIDLEACRERGIKFAGTNEHHGLLNVFSFLGPLVVHALHNIFIPIVSSKIVVISDNAFGLPIAKHLVCNQAEVFCVGPPEVFSGIEGAVLCGDLHEAKVTQKIDAYIIATTPSVSSDKTYNRRALTEFVLSVSPAACIHAWGDIEYETLIRAEIFMVPPNPVKEGHQGLVMSNVGPEPVIRLIVGGFKVAEVLARNSLSAFDLDFCQII